MMTHRQRNAQAESSGQPEPHSSIPLSTRRPTRLPRGHGAPQAAAVGATPGTSEIDLDTARRNQVALYEDVEVPQGLPESANLSGHGPSLRPKMTLEVPVYKPGKLWPRYTQMLEIYMGTVFPGVEFDLTSPSQKYTDQQDKRLWEIICEGVTDPQWNSLRARCRNLQKDKGAIAFRLLDKQIRGDVYKRRAEARYARDHLRFSEDMDVHSYSAELHQLHNDLIELGLEDAEKCALNLILASVNRLPDRFDLFAREQQKNYLKWDENEPAPLLEDFLQELTSEDSILRLNRLARNSAPAVHAAMASTPGGVPAIVTPATNPVNNPPPVQATNNPTTAPRPPPASGAAGRRRNDFHGSAQRREWQRSYPKKHNYNNNYNYNSNTSRGSYPDRRYGKPTCSKCGKSGRGHTSYECWQPDCTRCKTSAHTLAYCPKA